MSISLSLHCHRYTVASSGASAVSSVVLAQAMDAHLEMHMEMSTGMDMGVAAVSSVVLA